jgi:MFS family permease
MGERERWYHGINRGQWLAMIAAVLGWMFDGFEMGLHPLVAGPALQDLLRNEVRDDVQERLAGIDNSAERARLDAALATPGRQMFGAVKSALKQSPALTAETNAGLQKALESRIDNWNAYITAVFLFGAAGGGVVFGWLGDRIGRTKAMMWSVLAYSLFTGLGGFSLNPWHLGLCRFLAALGMGGEWALGVALVMETWPAKARPMMAGFIGAAANIGFLLVALVSLLINVSIGGELNWRYLMFIGVLPALLTFLIRLFVPESEKWKHAIANMPKPRVKEIFAPGLARRTILAILICGVALLGTWGAVQWIPLWAIRFNETAEHPVKYAKEFAQIPSALGACIGTLLAGVIAGGIARRPMYAALCVAALASAMALFRFEQFFGSISISMLFLVLVFLVGVTSASFYGFFPLYLPELFPTRVRATGQGLSYNFGRIFAGVGTFVILGPLGDFYKGANLAPTLAVVSLIYIVGLVFIWFAPETHGKPLPE